MCLIHSEIKETTEDIICYKLYVIFKGKLVSPYMIAPAPNMNEIVKTHLGEPYGAYNCLDEGFHSFSELGDTLKEKERLSRLYSIVIIMKCIIPKSSKCYIGTFWGRTSYCSDSIKLVEIN